MENLSYDSLAGSEWQVNMDKMPGPACWHQSKGISWWGYSQEMAAPPAAAACTVPVPVAQSSCRVNLNFLACCPKLMLVSMNHSRNRAAFFLHVKNMSIKTVKKSLPLMPGSAIVKHRLCCGRLPLAGAPEVRGLSSVCKNM